MKTETRTKNSGRNIVFSMLAYLIQIVLGFLVRRYFIYVFGTEYLGLNSLFSNVLSILSLAELGFGTAIVFAMYKPMAEDNKEEVRQLLQFYKKCYFIIGLIILGLGLLVLPFMGHFKARVPGLDVNLYIVYGLSLFNCVISYFFAHRRSLLYASQRNDIESKVNIIINISISAFQVVSILLIKNYYVYLALIGVSNIISNALIAIVTSRKYSDYLSKPETYLDPVKKKDINKNIRAMIFHKIGSTVVFSTDSILIYFMVNAASLGKYSNYQMIISYVGAIIAIFTNSIRSSIGNSIASETPEKNHELFKKLNFVQFWLASFTTICIFILSTPFIGTVLDKSGSGLSLDIFTILLICLSFYITQTRSMVHPFKDGAGLFYPDRYKALIEAIINLVASILLTLWLGLPGIILGTIISSITTSLWVEPYVLNKYYFKKSTLKYFGKYAIYTLAMLVSGAVTFGVCYLIPNGGIWLLLAKFIVCAIVPNIMLLLCLFWLPEFKECFKWGKSIIGGMLHKKQANVVVVSGKDIDGDGIADIQETVLNVDNASVIDKDNASNKNNTNETKNTKTKKQKDKSNGR